MKFFIVDQRLKASEAALDLCEVKVTHGFLTPVVFLENYVVHSTAYASPAVFVNTLDRRKS